MVKEHSDSERGNPLPPHRLLFPISSKVFLYASSHRQDNTYHGLCYTSRGALAGTRHSSMGPPHEGSIRRPIAPWANAPTTELHLAPLLVRRVCTEMRPQYLEVHWSIRWPLWYHVRSVASVKRWLTTSTWCDGSSDRSYLVDPLSYFSFQPVLHGWYYILSVGSCI